MLMTDSNEDLRDMIGQNNLKHKTKEKCKKIEPGLLDSFVFSGVMKMTREQSLTN